MDATAYPPPVHPTGTAGASAAAGSERMVLARLAQVATLRIPGVVATSSGPAGSVVTTDRHEHVDGVMCLAAPGGYDIALRLICDPVPLPALGQHVQTAVRTAARSVGIPVAEISVHIAELTDRAL